MEPLKIHQPAREDAGPPTLESVFTDYFLPEMETRGQVTKARQYRNSIARFTAFLKNAANTSSIRGIDEITDLHALQWQNFEHSNGLSASTINVHWTRIRAVFRRAGPAEKGNPQGLGIIDRVPYLRRLPVTRPRPRVVDLETIDALYRYGAPDMSWPQTVAGVTAGMLWRAFLVLEYNLAMRTRDLLSLRWSNLHSEPRSLDPDSENESPHGWVEWTPSKTKHHKPEPLVLPVNEYVRSHVEAIRSDGPFVFGDSMAKVSNDRLYGRSSRPRSGQWRRLIELASTHVEGGLRPFPIKTIRKTSNTQFNRLNPKLGSQILGHAPRTVNDVYYQQWEADLIRYVGELPQPASFQKPPRDSVRQTLFF